MTTSSPSELLATRDSKRLRKQISKPLYIQELTQFHPPKRIKIDHDKIEKECADILRRLRK